MWALFKGLKGAKEKEEPTYWLNATLWDECLEFLPLMRVFKRSIETRPSNRIITVDRLSENPLMPIEKESDTSVDWPCLSLSARSFVSCLLGR